MKEFFIQLVFEQALLLKLFWHYCRFHEFDLFLEERFHYESHANGLYQIFCFCSSSIKALLFCRQFMCFEMKWLSCSFGAEIELVITITTTAMTLQSCVCSLWDLLQLYMFVRGDASKSKVILLKKGWIFYWIEWKVKQNWSEKRHAEAIFNKTYQENKVCCHSG